MVLGCPRRPLLQVRSSPSSQARISQDDPGMPSVTSSYFKYGVVQGNVRAEGEWEGEWKGGVAGYTPL